MQPGARFPVCWLAQDAGSSDECRVLLLAESPGQRAAALACGTVTPVREPQLWAGVRRTAVAVQCALAMVSAAAPLALELVLHLRRHRRHVNPADRQATLPYRQPPLLLRPTHCCRLPAGRHLCLHHHRWSRTEAMVWPYAVVPQSHQTIRWNPILRLLLFLPALLRLAVLPHRRLMGSSARPCGLE